MGDGPCHGDSGNAQFELAIGRVLIFHGISFQVAD